MNSTGRNMDVHISHHNGAASTILSLQTIVLTNVAREIRESHIVNMHTPEFQD